MNQNPANNTAASHGALKRHHGLFSQREYNNRASASWSRSSGSAMHQPSACHPRHLSAYHLLSSCGAKKRAQVSSKRASELEKERERACNAGRKGARRKCAPCVRLQSRHFAAGERFTHATFCAHLTASSSKPRRLPLPPPLPPVEQAGREVLNEWMDECMLHHHKQTFPSGRRTVPLFSAEPHPPPALTHTHTRTRTHTHRHLVALPGPAEPVLLR